MREDFVLIGLSAILFGLTIYGVATGQSIF